MATSSQTGLSERLQKGRETPSKIPPRLPLPPVNRVVFDLETTGLGRTSHILQIAASGENYDFCRYVLPQEPIDPMAQSVNGLSFDEDEGLLSLNGQPVDAVTIGQALTEFLEFLEVSGPNVMLFAHNCKLFDSLILSNSMQACGMLAELEYRVTGFVDTLPLFREVCPGLSSYRQTALYEYFFQQSYPAHEAMNDVMALKRLLDLPCVTPQAVFGHYFDFDYIREQI